MNRACLLALAVPKIGRVGQLDTGASQVLFLEDRGKVRRLRLSDGRIRRELLVIEELLDLDVLLPLAALSDNPHLFDADRDDFLFPERQFREI